MYVCNTPAAWYWLRPFLDDGIAKTRQVLHKGMLVAEDAVHHCILCECVCVMTEWKQEHFSDVAVLLSKCEDVYSADVPSSLQVNN